MKQRIIYTICSAFIILFLGSCADNQKEISFDDILSSSNFYQESPLSESEEYSFDGKNFTLRKKNKRTGEARLFSGKYFMREGKYSDTGDPFAYVKLEFEDHNYSTIGFLIYSDGALVEPYKNRRPVKREDSYGLNTESWTVTLAPDYAKYKPTKK